MFGFEYTSLNADDNTRKIVQVAMRASTSADELLLKGFEHALHSAGGLRAEVYTVTAGRNTYPFAKVNSSPGQGLSRPWEVSVPPTTTRWLRQSNALAEAMNGLCKAELIHPHRPWRSLAEDELATSWWVRIPRLHHPAGERNFLLSPNSRIDRGREISGTKSRMIQCVLLDTAGW